MDQVSEQIDILIEKISSLCNKWDGIRTRTRDPLYVQREITICKQWIGRKGRDTFIRWALNNNFEIGLDLDRIDNDKGYSPSNCRWVTRSENMRNTRKSVTLIYKGQKINMKSLSEHKDCKVPYYLLKTRIRMLNWPIEEAMTRPAAYGAAWTRGTRKRSQM